MTISSHHNERTENRRLLLRLRRDLSFFTLRQEIRYRQARGCGGGARHLHQKGGNHKGWILMSMIIHDLWPKIGNQVHPVPFFRGYVRS